MNMVHPSLLNPGSIAVIGGSNNLSKPGGKIVENLSAGNFSGELYVVNPKEELVQGIKSYKNIADLPGTDLAILAIAAKYCPDTIKHLCEEKATRGFIILSAGFSEENQEGARLEKEIVEMIDHYGGSLIGPNCIGVINLNYQGVFTAPLPSLDPRGCDFISGSGATAVFIMETGMSVGLRFSSIYSVGNSAQLGVEDMLAQMDEDFDPDKSSGVKLLYIENIRKPGLLLKHSASLIKKGCRIAAIKAGSSEAGSRAASSHTGALASSDLAVDALFKKAGILRCYSRQELVTVASVFQHKELKGKRIAVITHAGGPAVMLTDSLALGGLEVPQISHPAAGDLLDKLFQGSSVSNPIDFLATGTAEQLGFIIDCCDTEFDNIDGMVVIFGSPGLFDVSEVYRLLDKKMKTCSKPIYPVLPSVVNAREAIAGFIASGRINFPDEVALGRALARVYRNPLPAELLPHDLSNRHSGIRRLIDHAEEGYLSAEEVRELLDAAEIPRVREIVAKSKSGAMLGAEEIGFPLVMKVVGILHKSDVGGVKLDITSSVELAEEYDRMMRIEGARAVMLQPMLEGLELFAGISYEYPFGHLVLFGLGGIFVETLKDLQACLAPFSAREAEDGIRQLRGFPLLEGSRGKEVIKTETFAGILTRLSDLVASAPEIVELDLNPLLATRDTIMAVDARIRISKTGK